MDELWTVNQAAQHIGVDPSQVRRYLREGLLPAERFGKSWMIHLTDLLTFKRPRRWPEKPEKAPEENLAKIMEDALDALEPVD